MDLAELIRLGECTFIDFKERYSGENSDLVHDILCLSNAKIDQSQSRFLVLGVRDNDYQVVGIQNDTNRKTSAQIIDMLRAAGINHIPSIAINVVESDGCAVDCLVISDRPEKPYFLTRDYRHGSKTVRAGVIYERNGDTNTPIDRCAQERHVEWMFKQRLGLDLSPKDRAIKYMKDPENWKYDYLDGGQMYFYYEPFPEFTIEEVSRGDREWAFEEPWVLGFPDQKATKDEFSLKFAGTKIGSLFVVWCDGARLAVSMPRQKVIGECRQDNGCPRSYYLIKGSMQQLFQDVLDTTYPQHSQLYFDGVVSIFQSEEEANRRLQEGYTANPVPYTYYRNVAGGFERTNPRGTYTLTRNTNA
ncbi:MAG: ATP-binding protein [Bdellovibrionaceae bacterium]|nr:ATP-binding protein [Pseudobdellovibrionaceae bacterium]